MKSKVTTMLRLYALSAALFLFAAASNAQYKIDRRNFTGHQRIQSLYTNKMPKNMVTPYIFWKMTSEFQDKISGTLIKEGKTIATTATIDDKSITVNHSLKKMWGDRLVPQLTVSGASEDGFVKIFSGGKYKRTLTGGINFIYFTKNPTGKYNRWEREKLWEQLKTQDICFNGPGNNSEVNQIKNHYKRVIDSLKDFVTSCKNLICNTSKDKQDASVVTTDCNKCSISFLEFYAKYMDEFSIYSKGTPDDCKKIGDFIKWLEDKKDSISEDFALITNLKVLDSLQLHAKWNLFRYKWFSGSLKINTANYSLFDQGSKDDLYTTDYQDVYISASASFNLLWDIAARKYINWFSPTLKFQNSRDFNADDSLINIQRQSSFIVGTDTLKAIKETSFYMSKAPRKNFITLELPYIFFNKEKGTGWDIAGGFKFSSSLENLYMRIGFFIPIAVDEKDVITIEPIIKLDKLNKSISFFREKLNFGFNISVSIPSFVKGD